MTIIKKGTEIRSLHEWETLAGPKKSCQWKNGRSAKEVAKAWLEDKGESIPSEVLSVLSGHEAFGPIKVWKAEPEAKLRFDSFSGEPRNSDLVVYAEDSYGPFLIAVEAKADESFSETVAETLADALERYLINNRSKGIARIIQLAQTIFGPQEGAYPQLGKIRYQLLTACAGALCEAERRGYSRTVMLVHEFITDNTSDDKHRQNASDLNMFLKRLSQGRVSIIRTGEICGPFIVPGKPLLNAKVDLYVGKASRHLRSKRS